LGALTTFSTYALETTHAVRTESSLVALLNFVANNFPGMLLVLLGMWVARIK
jgi:fluoride ion exporter CrcB/FEX